MVEKSELYAKILDALVNRLDFIPNRPWLWKSFIDTMKELKYVYTYIHIYIYFVKIERRD